MSYKLTKTQEIIESIFAIATGIPLGREAVKNLFGYNLMRRGGAGETHWEGYTNKYGHFDQFGTLLFRVYEDKKHYYKGSFHFYKPNPDVFVLKYFELDDALETVEEESASC